MERRLVLVRHAKSDYPSGVPDHGRPLAGKGRRNAQAAGRWLLAEGPRVGLTLCSDAQRARHTWEIMGSELLRGGLDVPYRLEPLLYGAGADDVLDLVRATPPAVTTVAVVGHEPTMSTTALILAGEGSDAPAVAAVHRRFGTNGIAVLRFTGDWPDLAAGGAVLETYVKPRA
jgi:phosphohistidine phosphatase